MFTTQKAHVRQANSSPVGRTNTVGKYYKIKTYQNKYQAG